MSLLTKVEVQKIAMAQNTTVTILKTIDASIKTAAQTGLYLVAITLTGGNITLGPQLVSDLVSRGFSAALTGTSSEILTVHWDN